jgi:hypothetical protein
VEEMFYFKTLQIFNANVSILPKEQVVSEDSWSSNTVLYHAAIDYVDGMEFEDIIQYSLIDSETGEVLKVGQCLARNVTATLSTVPLSSTRFKSTGFRTSMQTTWKGSTTFGGRATCSTDEAAYPSNYNL